MRIGADAELFRRLEKRGHHLKAALSSAPLSFALDDQSSLTRNGETHSTTMFHGVRREYREASEHWLSTQKNLCLSASSGKRHFPVPTSILPCREDVLACDLLIISDFNLIGGAYVSTINYIAAANALGYKVSVLQWRRYDLDTSKPLNPEIRQMALEDELTVVAPGQKVRASTVLITYPPILRCKMDRFPEIEFDNLAVVVNQMGERFVDGSDPQYDPLTVAQNLTALLGTRGLWAPISGLVRKLMVSDPRYPSPIQENWMPLIDCAEWCSKPVYWRGLQRAKPKIGRHGRDHYTKWPASPNALSAAFCVGRPCEVSILGGADRALDVISSTPENWTVHHFGAMDVRRFLSDLDFFVHYPHENYIEECGRAVIEAMACGIPVILPPVFKETFGSAATYAEPEQVWRTIGSLWTDEESYLAMARVGRQFVLDNCSWNVLRSRLDQLKGLEVAPLTLVAG